MTPPTGIRVPPPRRYTMSWLASLAYACNRPTLFVEYLNEVVQKTAMHVALGFDGGD